jgi:hypothetical protein
VIAKHATKTLRRLFLDSKKVESSGKKQKRNAGLDIGLLPFDVNPKLVTG